MEENLKVTEKLRTSSLRLGLYYPLDCKCMSRFLINFCANGLPLIDPKEVPHSLQMSAVVYFAIR